MAPTRWRDPTEHAERSQLEAMRELIASLRGRRRLTINVAINNELTPATEVSTGPAIWDTTQEQRAEVNRRIEQLSTYLADTGWDLEGWAE